MNKQICAAVAAATKQVTILGKGDRNSHGGYAFASIDKFLEMVNPICNKNGLFPVISGEGEDYYEGRTKNGPSLWGRYRFQITLHHESGETLPAQMITVPVQITGAQASGSAQSYALKQYFRGLFMIPTGDKDDPDFNKPEEIQVGISFDQAMELEGEIEELDADLPKFLQHFNVSDISNMTASQYLAAKNMLTEKARRKAAEDAQEAKALEAAEAPSMEPAE